MGVGSQFDAEFVGATVIPTDHFWVGRKGHQVRWIVIHGTAGSSKASDVAAWFQVDNPPTSAHYVVGLQGEIVQCVREADTAWGNGIVTNGADPWWSSSDNPNYSTISIEHVKPDTSNEAWLTDAQKAASFELVHYLVNKYAIVPQAASANGGIAAHSQIDPVNKIRCPGGYPWAELFDTLQGARIKSLQDQIVALNTQVTTLQQQLTDEANVVHLREITIANLQDQIQQAGQRLQDLTNANDQEVSALKGQYNALVGAAQALLNAKPLS